MILKRDAPAKVNLALHVTGKRDDGYHLLDSLVVFAGIHDRLRFEAADTLLLDVTGPMGAGVPTDATNLVMRAAGLFEGSAGARITLEKHLPHAAGIGGGSADAAAALHGLSALWQVDLPDAAAILGLGADLPVCLHGRPARMRGVGEVIDPVPPLPPMWVVLVNPRVAVPTRAVFAGLERVDGAAMAAPDWQDFDSFIAWLRDTRNDLERPARALAPEIDTALAALRASSHCALARMSGSGATCFGLFETPEMANAAAAGIVRDHPDWWVVAAPVLDRGPS